MIIALVVSTRDFLEWAKFRRRRWWLTIHSRHSDGCVDQQDSVVSQCCWSLFAVGCASYRLIIDFRQNL